MRQLLLTEAADILGLPVSGVEALIGAGYLAIKPDDGTISLSELKAFQARNAPDGNASADELLAEIGGPHTGADAILDAVAESVDDMARRTADIVCSVFPEAAEWSDDQRKRFEAQARNRYEAIITVTRRQEIIDDDMVADLADAGGAAAFAGAPLPQVLLTLRVSRDLLVQTAVSAAEDLGRSWSLALAVVLTRILPALDTLLDTVARGYWNAVIQRDKEASARYEHVVEHSASGVYELDLDGRVVYANPSLATISGVARHELLGARLFDVLPPVRSTATTDVYHTPTVSGWRELRVRRSDGVERNLAVQISERTTEGTSIGYDGVVRDVTAERDLERQKSDFLGLVTHELRQPLTTILGLGATLESHADRLPSERISRIGQSIHDQSRRMARLADDLHDISQIQSERLSIQPRVVDLGIVVESALAQLPDPGAVDVTIGTNAPVLADPNRVEQVLVHLTENAFRHGEPPVTLEVTDQDGFVEISVRDHGHGVDPVRVGELFTTLTPTEGARRRDRVTGLGLPVVRGLVEAMGGRAGYDRTLETSTTRFWFTLPVAR